MKYIFFGTPKEATTVLNILKEHSYLPALVVTAPDRPSGRGLNIEESPVAVWAHENSIPVYKPESLKNEETLRIIKNANFDLAIVFAYGKIIPQSVLDIPSKGTLNIHPSLLPLYRGPAPVESAILAGEQETGVSVMILDSDMDHGPIVAQVKVIIESSETAPQLLERLVTIGAEKLAEILPDYISGKMIAKEQDHELATYTKKLAKSDGEIKLDDEPAKMYRKYLAYTPWPGIYFFDGKSRIVIKKASLENGTFSIKRVVPEGKKEMDYAAYLRNKK